MCIVLKNICMVCKCACRAQGFVLQGVYVCVHMMHVWQVSLYVGYMCICIDPCVGKRCV